MFLGDEEDVFEFECSTVNKIALWAKLGGWAVGGWGLEFEIKMG